MERIEIPRYIDDPPHFLLWSADELAPVAIGLVIGVLTANAFILTMLGLVATKFYRRFRDGKPDGYMLHGLYWSGLLPLQVIGGKNPFLRTYLP